MSAVIYCCSICTCSQFLIKYLGRYKLTLVYYYFPFPAMSLRSQGNATGCFIVSQAGAFSRRNGESWLQFVCCLIEHLPLAVGISFEKWKPSTDHSPHSRRLPDSTSLCFCAVLFSTSAGLVMGEVFFMGSKSKKKCSHPGHSHWSQRSDTETVMQRSSVMGALSQGLGIQWREGDF